MPWRIHLNPHFRSPHCQSHPERTFVTAFPQRCSAQIRGPVTSRRPWWNNWRNRTTRRRLAVSLTYSSPSSSRRWSHETELSSYSVIPAANLPSLNDLPDKGRTLCRVRTLESTLPCSELTVPDPNSPRALPGDALTAATTRQLQRTPTAC